MKMIIYWQIGNYLPPSCCFLKVPSSYLNWLKHNSPAICRLGQINSRASIQIEETPKYHHTRTSGAPTRDLASFSDEYRKLAIDCLKVLRVEMQLETIFHMQVCKTSVIYICYVLIGIERRHLTREYNLSSLSIMT